MQNLHKLEALNSFKVAGADLAFVKDTAALVILQVDILPIRKPRTGRYVFRVSLATDRRWKPGEKPLRPNEVIHEMVSIAREHSCFRLCSDVHYRALVIEHLSEDITLVPFPSKPEAITKTYQEIKYDLGAGALDLSLASKELIKDLENVQAKPAQGGLLSILHGRNAEGHGDSASAFACAYHCAYSIDAQTEENLVGNTRRFSGRGDAINHGSDWDEDPMRLA